MIDTFKSHGVDVSVEIFSPSKPGRHPAIVIVHGTRGMYPPFGRSIRAFARALVHAGYVALIPAYLERTDTPAARDISGDAVVLDAFEHDRDTWIEALDDCLIYARRRPNVRRDQLGLVAFSMGGHLALRLAKRPRATPVDAVVSFFAPIQHPPPFSGLGGGIGRLPPVQIHHGEDDGPPVFPAESRTLEGLLIAAKKVKGRDYEIYFYPGQGHGFKGSAVTVSTKRTIDFFTSKIR